MEDDNVAGSVSSENRQLVDGEGDNTSDYLLLGDEEQNPRQEFDLNAGTNEFFPSLLTNQGRLAGSGAQLCLQQQCQPLSTNDFSLGLLVACGTQPWAQQLGQPAGPNGCLLEPCINQGQGNQAAAATHSLIAQHSGQSPVISTGDPPHSQRNIVKIRAPASLVRKRQSDRKYRDSLKKRKQDLEDENGRLQTELEASVAENGGLEDENRILKTELEASVAENGRLEDENRILKTKLEACEAENERLRSKLETDFHSKVWDEVDSLKRNFACLDQRTQTQDQKMQNNYACLDQRMKTQDQKMQINYACLDQRMRTQSTELAQLRNKFQELELNQQNQRTREKRSMSSNKEFRAQIQEDDSIDSAQNTPIISAAGEAELAGKEWSAEAHLNWKRQILETIVAEGERWESTRPRKFNQTDWLTEYQTET